MGVERLLEELVRLVVRLEERVGALEAQERAGGTTLWTPDGGWAVRLVAGEALSRGNGVYVRQAGGTDGRVWKVPVDGDMCIGVAYADAAAGDAVWVTVAGIALVLPASTVTATRGYVLVSSAAEAGRADQSASVPSATSHWREWGHFLDTGAGAGALTRALLHFN